jgi:DNA-binding NarL/FixJ family response regulator
VDRKLRLVVVEDENLLRDLLVMSLEQIPTMTVVAAYKDGAAAFNNQQRDQPDVALLDINLGAGWTGIETGLQLREINPHLGIVLLSNYARPDILASLPESSLPGWSYLLKRSVRDVATLARAIEGAASHLVVLDPELVKRSPHRRHSPLDDLTPRQLQILELVAQGYTNAAIAKTLFLSEKSVENHLTAIYATLHIESMSPDQHPRVKAALAFLADQGDDAN